MTTRMKYSPISPKYWWLLFLGVLLLGACGGPAPTPRLRISALPEIEPELLIKRMDLLTPYLSTDCNQRFTFVPMLDRSELTTAVTEGRIDLAFMDVAAFQSLEQSAGHRIVIPDAEKDAAGVVLTRADGSLNKLQNLNGEEFLCTYEYSTTGHLLPLEQLKRNNSKPTLRFVMDARELCRMLVRGEAPAGAVPSVDWDVLESDFPELREMAVTTGLANGAWVVRDGLDADMVQAITGAFLRLNWHHPYHRRILEIFGVREFIPVDAETFRDSDRIIGRLVHEWKTGN
jgi:ABC-type phosphate/phosphonate transport system substrate-binding protein